jgi:hypothetical protein
MSAFWQCLTTIFASWFGIKMSKVVFSADYRNDRVYKQNVRDLIERHRKFEDARK